MTDVSAYTDDRHTLLVVDDDTDLLASYQKVLRRAGYGVLLAESGTEAFDLMRRHNPSIVLTDIRMPRMDGVTLLREIATNYPDTIVIIMTAFGTVARAVETMKEGAFDFLTKPFTADQLLEVVRRAEYRANVIRRNRDLHEDLAGLCDSDMIVGQSPAMRSLFIHIRTAAQSNGSVLILGESGTGKELVARAIHAGSSRSKGPFVALNCGALPDHLVESELFGHEKGAFTGAHESRPGLLTTANNGVFFLDEIGDLPLHLQSKLLRALEERRVRRLGGRTETDFDVRVISATNRDIEEMVSEGQLREDLYYRLNTFSIVIPPLRERDGDVPLLAMCFLKHFATESGRSTPTGFTDEALAKLNAYHWPGNVRQLQHVVERAIAVAEGEQIGVADLPVDLRANGAAPTNSSSEADFAGLHEEASLYEVPLTEARQQVLDSFERRYLMRLLSRHGGNVRQASHAIGMERKSLYRLLDRHGIDPNDYRANAD